MAELAQTGLPLVGLIRAAVCFPWSPPQLLPQLSRGFAFSLSGWALAPQARLPVLQRDWQGRVHALLATKKSAHA